MGSIFIFAIVMEKLFIILVKYRSAMEFVKRTVSRLPIIKMGYTRKNSVENDEK